MSRRKSLPIVLLLGLIAPIGCGGNSGQDVSYLTATGGSGNAGITPGSGGIPVNSVSGLTIGSSGSAAGSTSTSSSSTTTGGSTTATGTSGGSSSTTTTTGSDPTGPITNPAPSNTTLLAPTNTTSATDSPASIVQYNPTNVTDSNTGMLSNNTQYLLVVQGFGQGQSQGQLQLINASVPNGANNVILTSNGVGTSTRSLTNPVDIVPYLNGFLVTDGFGLNGQGRLVYVSNINAVTGTAQFDDMTLQASTPLQNPEAVVTDGTTYAYVSEYTGESGGTGVRRINLQTGEVGLYVQGINFPAGLAIDQNNLYICVNGRDTAAGANGGVVVAPLTTATLPLAVGTAPVEAVVPNNAFNLPYSCALDSFGGLVVGEGFGLQLSTSGSPAGQAGSGVNMGAIDYIPAGQTTTQLNSYTIAPSLSYCTGVHTSPTSVPNQTAVGFVQAIPGTQGIASQLLISVASVPTPASTVTNLVTGLNSPYDFIYGVVNSLPTGFVTTGLAQGTQGQVLRLQ
jgi:hypothetical protein